MAMECTNCQREFRVALAPPLLTCSRHGSIPATTVCNRCGTYLCATCAFPDKRSGSLCPSCAAVPVAAQPRQTGLAPRQCAMHPAMRAVGSCSGCGVAVCGTCAFDFPGGVRLCPRCAASPQKGLSAKRKKALVWSYVLAVWTTLGLAVLLSGVLASSLQSKSDVEVLGMVLMIVIFAPSIIGTAMGFSAMDRRLSNPAAVWIAIVWNGIILAVLLLLTIIGNLSG